MTFNSFRTQTGTGQQSCSDLAAAAAAAAALSSRVRLGVAGDAECKATFAVCSAHMPFTSAVILSADTYLVSGVAKHAQEHIIEPTVEHNPGYKVYHKVH